MSAPNIISASSSGGGTTGSGTTNTIAKWTSGTAVGNSSITDNGTTVTFTGSDLASTFVSGAVWTLTNTLQYKATPGAGGQIRMTIDPAVGVGINTGTPNTALHVVGTTTFAGNLISNTAQAWTLAASNANALNIQSGLLNFNTSTNKLTYNSLEVGYRPIPPVGTQTGSYTLATTDVGKYVQVGTNGSITIPNSTFAEGDVVSICNNTTGNITITCSITNAYISGVNTTKASVTLATRGIATVLFLSGTTCVITGAVS